MPSVTQRVDSYLGGVSRQSDDKKLPGQVEECLNGYPDPTFGLTKRPGLKWIANLGSGTTYDNSKWFYINRTATEKYIGCITPASGGSTGAIYIWNILTGVAANVTYGTGAQAYLTGALRTDYDILTVQDTTIVTNRTTQVGVTAAPSFTANTQATIKLVSEVSNVPYELKVNSTSVNVNYTASSTDRYSTVLTALNSGITGLGLGFTIVQTADSLHISRSTPFTLTGTGGVIGNRLTIFQDQVSSLVELPNESKNGHVVKILSSGATAAAYYMKYTADNGTSGPGFWSETVAPDVSTGLVDTTMPHELLNPTPNNFVFQTITYKDRVVGDDDTNKHPSFNGSTIQQGFFHNNRLGFLSGDAVILSQSAQFFNFYHTTAQTVTDADPIDLIASTIRPAALHSIIPTTQGLVLFSANQQFLMSSIQGNLTPASANIRAISNYEVDTEIDPVDMGVTLNFISKTPSYTRVFAMITRGENENPTVLDIGRVVNEWVPATIDTLIASPQNQFIAFSGQSSKYIYFFRTYNDGEKNVVQAWFNWEAPGTVQAVAADSDEFFAVTKQGTQYTLSKASLSQSPEDAIIVNNDGKKINPCIDLYATASSVTYDATNDFSKCFLPYDDISYLSPVLIIKGSTATGNFIESGFVISPERDVESGNPYFKVPGKDLTSVASDVIVGFKYDFDIKLPKTYFKIDPEGKKSDFTANLTIARMKFAVGLSGVMGFKLKSRGVGQGQREYTADGVTTEFSWIDADLSYIDDNQIKVKQNNVETTAFTVDRTGDAPKVTLNSASTELKNLAGNGTDTTFDLTFVPTNLDRMKVKVNGVDLDSTQFTINGQFIHFTTPPPTPTLSSPSPWATNNVLVYSADEIVIFLDEWYNLNPVVKADQYLANDIPLSEQSVFTLPIHQKSDNFTLRLFNDTPFPVSLNSMMWEGIYSPRFYRRI